MPNLAQNHAEQARRDIADWNSIAAEYGKQGTREDPLQNPMYQQLADVLWQSLGVLTDLNVLDLGCGDGWLSGMMKEKGAQWPAQPNSDNAHVVRQWPICLLIEAQPLPQ